MLKPEMLWHWEYYDGAINGLAIYDGKKVWFQMIRESDFGDRTFGLYRISPEMLEKIETQHRLFQEMVGFHCDHDPNIYKPFKMDSEKFIKFYSERHEMPEIDMEKDFIIEVEWHDFDHWHRPKKIDT